MTDEQLLRYSRHILLDALGIEGQERLLATHALLIGAGGLGSPAALYLASAGIGKLTLVDDDTVDFTNLQRQILHTQARVGMAKAESGKQALTAINPEINIVPLLDIMLVLLTIFMVTAPLITTGNIDLPSVSKSASPQEAGDVLTLSINAQGEYQLSSKRKGVLADDASLADIVAQVQSLQTASPQLPVVIAASRKLSYDSVMQAMDALRKAQIQQIGLAVAKAD